MIYSFLPPRSRPVAYPPYAPQPVQESSEWMRENELMMKGQLVPPTPYASPAHTQLHAEFMNSDIFQAVPNNSPIIVNFIDHVIGELIAQTSRGQAGTTAEGALPPRPQTEVPLEAGRTKLVGDQSGANKAIQDAIPALIQGQGQTPVAI